MAGSSILFVRSIILYVRSIILVTVHWPLYREAFSQRDAARCEAKSRVSQRDMGQNAPYLCIAKRVTVQRATFLVYCEQ